MLGTQYFTSIIHVAKSPCEWHFTVHTRHRCVHKEMIMVSCIDSLPFQSTPRERCREMLEDRAQTGKTFHIFAICLILHNLTFYSTTMRGSSDRDHIPAGPGTWFSTVPTWICSPSDSTLLQVAHPWPRQTLPLLWVCYTFLFCANIEWVAAKQRRIKNSKPETFHTWWFYDLTRAPLVTPRYTAPGGLESFSLPCGFTSSTYLATPEPLGTVEGATHERTRRPHLAFDIGPSSREFSSTGLMCDAVRSAGAPHAKFVKSFVTPEVTGRWEVFFSFPVTVESVCACLLVICWICW